MVTSGDEICDVNSHLNVSDEGESVKLEGTLYAVADKNTDIMQFYLNPVYQTESGEFYVTQGNSWSLSGELGGSGTMTLDEETSLTENGETKTILFSGDLGNIDRPLIRNPQSPPDADYVVIKFARWAFEKFKGVGGKV